MKHEESPIDSKLAAAIRAATGIARSTSPATQVEAALGDPRKEALSVSSGGQALSRYSSIPEALAATALTPGTAAGAIRTNPGQSRQMTLPSVIAGLLEQRPAGGASGWTGIVSHLNPVLRGILRVFSGGAGDARAPLPLAARPTTAHLELGIRKGDGGLYMIDREDSGLPRANKPIGPPAVVVQVEAMDSRSFLDRTPEIAEALQRALLESEGMQRLLSSWRE